MMHALSGNQNDDSIYLQEASHGYEDENEDSHALLLQQALLQELKHGEPYNIKIGPAYDGRMNWWRFEEYVADWQDITTVDKNKQGPMLKTRLTGLAFHKRHLLERDKLKTEDGTIFYGYPPRAFYQKPNINFHESITEVSGNETSWNALQSMANSV